jgi:DNA-binding CsgD family transcriptional regulator
MIANILNARGYGSGCQIYKVQMSITATLAGREQEVVELIREELQNHTIADLLVIREAMVRNHLTSILAKLGSMSASSWLFSRNPHFQDSVPLHCVFLALINLSSKFAVIR